MENTKRVSAANRVAALLVAGAIALSGTAIIGSATQADASTADTAVYVVADNDKIIASAPTRIDVAVNPDGTFECPDAASTLLENGSAFGIHVSEIGYAAEDGWNYAENATGADNEIGFYVQPGAGEDVYVADDAKTISSGDWNMAKDGDEGSTIGLECAGEIRNVTKDLASAQHVGTINWAFAAGMLS